MIRKRNDGSILIYSLAVLALLATFLLMLQLALVIYADRTASAAASTGADVGSLLGAGEGDGYEEAIRVATELPGLRNVSASEERSGETVTVLVSGQPIRVMGFAWSIEATATRRLNGG